MARIRTIKPEFFTSMDVIKLSPWARLLYVALWCEADREGRLKWSPETFKVRYFPADSVDIDDLCDELISRRLVVLYGDSALGYIPTFRDHQHINPRETPSVLPDPPKTVESSRVSDACSRVSDAQGGRKEGRNVEKMPADPAGSSHSPNGSATPAPNGADGADYEPDPAKEIFDLGVNILTRGGHSERSARGLVARLRKLRSDQEAAAILVAAKSATDPAAYIAKAIQPKPRRVQLC